MYSFRERYPPPNVVYVTNGALELNLLVILEEVLRMVSQRYLGTSKRSIGDPSLQE